MVGRLPDFDYWGPNFVVTLCGSCVNSMATRRVFSPYLNPIGNFVTYYFTKTARQCTTGERLCKLAGEASIEKLHSTSHTALVLRDHVYVALV